jgi:hypothetical protein
MLGDFEYSRESADGDDAREGIPVGDNGCMDSQRIRGTTPDIISAARRLRQNPTPAEQVLWQALKSRQLNGLKFRFQHPVESFIAVCRYIKYSSNSEQTNCEYLLNTQDLNHL